MSILSNNFYYQPLQIDSVNTQVYGDFIAKEGDANGRGLLVTLTENGLQKDTTGITLNLKWAHTIVAGLQNLDPFEVVDLTKGLYKITYPTDMLRKGKVDAFIQIIDSGKLIGSRNIKINVEATVGDDTAIESSNEFRALASALVEVQGWNARIDDVEQEFKDKANNLDATYPTRLVSVETALADKAEQTQADSLQGQINTIVLQGTSGDSSAEVAQARVDYKGSTFETVKGHLDNIENMLFNGIDEVFISPWEQGGLSGGAPVGSTTRIRTVGYHTFTKDFTVVIPSGYKLTVWKYDVLNVYNSTSGWLTAGTIKLTFDQAYPVYKFTFAKSDDAAILPSEGDLVTLYYDFINTPSDATVGRNKLETDVLYQFDNPQIRFDLISGDYINLVDKKDADYLKNSQFTDYTGTITGNVLDKDITGFIALKENETLYATLNGASIFGGVYDTKLAVYTASKVWVSTVRTNHGYSVTPFVATEDCLVRVQYLNAYELIVSTINHKLINREHVDAFMRDNVSLKQNVNSFKVGTGKNSALKNVDVSENVVDGFIDYTLQGSTFEYVYGFLTDFKDKLAGSILINDNIALKTASSVLKQPTDPITEMTTADYEKINKSDTRCQSVTTLVTGEKSQVIFSFNVVKEFENRYGYIPTALTGEPVSDLEKKIAWLKLNAKNGVLKVFWSGFGTCPTGNKAYFQQWGGSWLGSTINTSATPSILTRDFAISSLGSDGLVHFIAYTDASDGAIASTINTDYIYLEVVMHPTYKSVGEDSVTFGSHRVTIESKSQDSLMTNENIFNLTNPLRAVNSDIYDTVNSDGIITRNVSNWTQLVGGLDWQFNEEFIGLKQVLLPVASLPNCIINSSNVKVIRFDGIQLPAIIETELEGVYLSETGLVINIPNKYSGWIDGYAPTQGEIKAYFYGFKMCKSDGSAWDGLSTKNWCRINNITGQIWSVEPTTQSASYYTPYKMLYQLQVPVTEIKIIAPLSVFNGGLIEIDSGVVSPLFNYKAPIENGMVLQDSFGIDNESVSLNAYSFSGYLSHKRDPIAIKVVPDVPLIESGKPSFQRTVTVNDSVRHQEFKGAGYAFTEGTAWLLWNKMTAEQRHVLLNEMFSPKQGNMSTLRICMGTSDFRIGDVYTYDDTGGEPDYNMERFSIGEGTPGTPEATKDLTFIVPILQEILEINPGLTIIAAPWYLPDWMGNPFEYTPESAEALALYFRRFIEEYKKHGIPIHAISPINEPELTFSGQWSATNISDFTVNYLAPMIFKYEPSTKIMAFDANYDAVEFFDIVNDDSAPFIDAIALHTYHDDISHMQRVLQKYKQLEVWITERRTMLNDHVWLQSQIMLSEIAVAGLQHGVSLVTIWNLALNENGYPNYGGTLGRRGAITIYDDGSGKVVRNLDYYMIRALAQNVKAGARRIESTNYNPVGKTPDIGSVAFVNTDGSISVMIANQDYGTREVYVRLLGKIYKLNVPPYGYVQVDLGKNLNTSLPLPDGILPS